MYEQPEGATITSSGVCRVIRRPSDGSVKHYVGQIMTHARYHYKGVIYGQYPTLSHLLQISVLVAALMLPACLPYNSCFSYEPAFIKDLSILP